MPPHSRCLALNNDRTTALVGGSDGSAHLYSLDKQEAVLTLSTSGGAVKDGALLDQDNAVIATASGEVQIYSGAKKTSTFKTHAGAANGVAVHPTGEILASVGADKSFVLYDVIGGKTLSQVYTDSGKHSSDFLPTAHLADYSIQNFYVWNSIRMDIFSLAEEQMARSRSLRPITAKVPPTLTPLAPCSPFLSRRMAPGLPRL